MKWPIALITVLLSFLPSYPLTLKEAELFLESAQKGACSLKKYQELKDTELKEPFLLLFSQDCFSLRKYKLAARGKDVKNPYGKFTVALSLRRIGREKEARKIFKELFSQTNALDEDILTANLGFSEYLFEPKVLRKKVWRAAASGEIGQALFYLSFLRDDPYYTYLLAYTYMKWGKKELAKELFRSSIVEKSKYYLVFLAKEPVEKLFYYQEALNSPLPLRLKKRLATYTLDFLFREDLGLFRRALKLTEGIEPTYSYFKYRELLFSKGCLKELPEKEPQKWWKRACGFKGELPKGINFYSLILNPPDRFPYPLKGAKRAELKDKGLKLLKERGFCNAISLIEEKTPQTALALYLCGEYRKGIKFAASFKGELNKYPYLLRVLYPNPPLFKNDLISLSIARQESLFEQRALSRSGAVGLMQIMPRTGKYIAEKLREENFTTLRLYEPELNYRFGSYYIYKQLKEFKLFPLAAAAYNCGPGRVRRALKLFGPIKESHDLILFTDVYLPFSETRDYVKRTLVNLYYYSNLYGTGKEWKTFLKP
jgi:soluble lytic murein transglycosylase